MNKIILFALLFLLFAFGCQRIKDIKPITDMEEGKIYNATVFDSFCKIKGSTSCCNYYGCYVSAKFQNLVLTHQYLEFEEDTCSHTGQCNLTEFNPSNYTFNSKSTRLQKINGDYDFIDLPKKSLSNKG